MVGTMGKNMHNAYEKNMARTFVYHSAGHTTDPYQADVPRFVNEYKDDKLCHIRPRRHHTGYENFKFRITSENHTNLIQRLHKYEKMDLRNRIQSMS